VTNISRHPLSIKKQSQLFQELGNIVSSLGSADVQLFLSELLGPEEQIMIAKRFSALVLLEQGYTGYKTAKVLHLSTATVNKLDSERKLGHYKHVLKWLNTGKKQRMDLLKILDSILTVGGIMPRYGEQSKALRKIK